MLKTPPQLYEQNNFQFANWLWKTLLQELSAKLLMVVIDWWYSASQPKYEELQANFIGLPKLTLGIFYVFTHLTGLFGKLFSVRFQEILLNKIKFCVKKMIAAILKFWYKFERSSSVPSQRTYQDLGKTLQGVVIKMWTRLFFSR